MTSIVKVIAGLANTLFNISPNAAGEGLRTMLYPLSSKYGCTELIQQTIKVLPKPASITGLQMAILKKCPSPAIDAIEKILVLQKIN